MVVMSPEPSRPTASRVKSCTGCRQVKLTCDARKTMPQPCSRCKSKNLECRFDANFKRISTRKLAEEISKEVHALRSKEQITSSKAASPGRNFDTSLLTAEVIASLHSASPNETSPERQVFLNHRYSQRSKSWLEIGHADSSHSYMLGCIILDPDTVIKLFRHFEVYYLPHAVFLQPISSLSDLVAKSPFLFWTIVLVASRSHDQGAAIHEQVTQEYHVLLSEIVQIAIQKIETVHSLLILCLWPIPQARQMYDPSWNYVGLATSAATQMNCHNPLAPGSDTSDWKGYSDLLGSKITPAAQALTWIGCFWIGTEIATFQGFPPPMSASQYIKSIDRALHAISNLVPESWNVLVSILKITTISTSTLDSVEDPALHFSLTQTFEDQLDELKRTNFAIWTPQLEMEMCSARLYLFTLTFTLSMHPKTIDHVQRQIQRQTILHKGFEAASNLITEATKLGQVSAASGFHPGGLLTFAPKHCFTALFNATTFLFRFLATYTAGMPAQESYAMDSIIEAHKIFQSFPGIRDFTRAAIHIEFLVTVLRDSTSERATGFDELAVTNRLGASVMLDAVFRAGRQRNRDPTTGKSVPVHEWKSLNESFAGRLPQIPAQKSRENSVNLVNSSSDDTDFDLGRQPPPAIQEPSWWGDWENYMDYFEVGEDQWSSMEQPMGFDSLMG